MAQDRLKKSTRRNLLKKATAAGSTLALIGLASGSAAADSDGQEPPNCEKGQLRGLKSHTENRDRQRDKHGEDHPGADQQNQNRFKRSYKYNQCKKGESPGMGQKDD